MSHEESASAAKAESREPIWDLVVRIGHWTLVVCFAYSYFAEPDFPGHDVSGYIILAVVSWRLVWGFVGSRYARFSAFIYSPRETLQYTLAAMRMGEAREYGSHNPMGALMVFAFLLMLPFICITGVMLLGLLQFEGPLAGVVPESWEYFLDMSHLYSAQMMAALVVAHVAGALWACWWHRQNYVLAMITGYKSRLRRRRKRTSAADRRN